jgi:serine/threonine protein kinase
MTQEEFRKRYVFNLKTDNIGGGSFGTVYKAYDTILDIEVAIKVSEVKNIGDKEFSLLEEYKAIENLTAHQNIANYEKVYRFESFPAIYDYGIMQYYALGNLSNYLKNNEVSIEKRESITTGILEGIAFLHQHKVVHRDLKPSNILVVDRRGKIIPKITDFGLSKQAEADGKASRFTNSFAGGTLQYSSPEQLKGLPLKLNTDLWSFGAIAYEILTGKTLFEADSEGTASAEWQNSITQKILHADISSELGSLPIVWQKVVTVCLERDVNKRIQNAKLLFSILNGDENVAKEEVLEAQTIIKEPEKTSTKEEVLEAQTIVKDPQKTSTKEEVLEAQTVVKEPQKTSTKEKVFKPPQNKTKQQNRSENVAPSKKLNLLAPIIPFIRRFALGLVLLVMCTWIYNFWQSNLVDNEKLHQNPLKGLELISGWELTLDINTSEAYQNFIDTWPNSIYAKRAEEKLSMVNEEFEQRAFSIFEDRNGQQIAKVNYLIKKHTNTIYSVKLVFEMASDMYFRYSVPYGQKLNVIPNSLSLSFDQEKLGLAGIEYLEPTKIIWENTFDTAFGVNVRYGKNKTEINSVVKLQDSDINSITGSLAIKFYLMEREEFKAYDSDFKLWNKNFNIPLN